jgi:hypothetical protein
MILSAAKDNVVYLNFYEQVQANSGSHKQSKINSVKRQITNVSPFVANAMALEISKDDKIVFVGGSTNQEGHSGKAAVSAVQFNQYLVHLDSKSIGNQQEGRNVF